MKDIISLIIMAALTLPVGTAAAAPTSEKNTGIVADASTELAVEVDPSVPNADTVHRRVEASGRAALASIESPRAAGDRILVHVMGEQYEFRIRVAAVRRDVTLDENTVSCECNTAELSERVSAEITRAAAHFSQPTNEPSTAEALALPTPEEPPMPVEPSTSKEQDASPRKPVILPAKPRSPAHPSLEPRVRTSEPALVPHDSRRLRVASVATLVAGSVLVLVGAGFTAAGSTELLDKWRHYERNWRPLGYTIGGVGLAGVAVGGSLMIFDEIRCRRRPDSCAPRSRYSKRHEVHRMAMGANR